MIRRRRGRWTPWLIGVVAAGCVDAGEPVDREPVAVRMEDGTDVIRISDPGDPPALAWGLVDPVMMGARDGTLAFGRIADVAPRAGGGMWVLDAQAKTVVGVSGSGDVALVLGGEGDGPGELRTPTGVFETSDAGIAVSESYPPRVHWFDPSGAYIESESVDGPAEAAARSAPTLGQWSVLPDRTSLVHVWSFPMPGDPSGETHTLVRTTRGVGGAARPDTLLEWKVASMTADPGGEVKLIAARPQWAAGPAAVAWWTPADRYEIRALGSTGDILRIVELEREPVRIDRALQSEIEQFFLRSAGGGPAAAAEMERVLERATWPERLPGVARLWVSWPSGRLFAAPYRPALFREPPVMRLDVFEPDGGYAGWVDLPPGFSPRRFAADRVYGVLTDELGVEVAAHYRLAAPE